jgi:hypothetical protein
MSSAQRPSQPFLTARPTALTRSDQERRRLVPLAAPQVEAWAASSTALAAYAVCLAWAALKACGQIGPLGRLHPALAYEWELRLQHELSDPTFTLDERDAGVSRAAFLSERPELAREVEEREARRRERMGGGEEVDNEEREQLIQLDDQ